MQAQEVDVAELHAPLGRCVEDAGLAGHRRQFQQEMQSGLLAADPRVRQQTSEFGDECVAPCAEALPRGAQVAVVLARFEEVRERELVQGWRGCGQARFGADGVDPASGYDDPADNHNL